MTSDPGRLRFLDLLAEQLAKLACDALHHSRGSGVPLPEGFDHCVASACHHLKQYRAAVVKRIAEAEEER